MATVGLTRVVRFSSGHRYWEPMLTPEQNRERYGRWASPWTHGHNYVLHVGVVGRVDPRNGMVVNIKTIDDVLQREVVARLDQRSLNDEVPELAGRSPSLENLLTMLQTTLSDLPRCDLERLELEETPTLRASWSRVHRERVTLTRTYEFAASHRLHAPALSDEENRALFGKCNNPHGHGHNYLLEVSVSGEPDPATGMVVALDQLDDAVNREIVDRYDHMNLDVDIPELLGQVTTSENVALAIFARLEPVVPGRLESVVLHETARNKFEVKRSD